MRHFRSILLSLAICGSAFAANAQTLQVTNDAGVAITTTQTVNVGEHVRLQLRVTPAASFTNPQWIVTGSPLKDWTTKDGEAVSLGLNDYLAPTLHLLWRDVTPPTSPNVVHVTVLAGGTLLTATASFRVVRGDKPEKFYSDDLLMENHNNWHSVHMFSLPTTRRGDLFLTWHRSQLEYFNRWRTYFGYPPLANWDPATPWLTGSPVASKQHPSTSVAPAQAFSQRHDLITLDLTDGGLAHAHEGEFDFVTQAESRGRRASFVSAAYTLKMDTVKEVLCGSSCPSTLSGTGIAVLPSFWKTAVGTTSDPWYAAGCPDQNRVKTCTVSTKKSLKDYTLRQLGESIESGQYRTDFQVNYHALAHIAASDDMSDPATSMRDPIFWSWHSHLDSILTQWQALQGAEAQSPLTIYQNPKFDAGFTKVTIPFALEVIEEFVLPANVEVNGSRATSVVNVSLNPGQSYIFEFSGFAVPPPGPVELVLRREVNNTIRTILSDPRPYPTLIVSKFGQVLTPSVLRLYYTKP